MSCGGSAPRCPASALGVMTCPWSHSRTVPWQCHTELCLVLCPFPEGADEGPGVPVPCPVGACAWQTEELPGGAGCHTGTSRGCSSSQGGGTGVPPLSPVRCLRHGQCDLGTPWCENTPWGRAPQNKHHVSTDILPAGEDLDDPAGHRGSAGAADSGQLTPGQR